MSPTLKHIAFLTNCVLLIFLFCFYANGNETNNINSPIDATWTPSFDSGSITLVVTNTSNRTAKVVPSLFSSYNNPSPDLLPKAYAPDLISISILFTGPGKSISFLRPNGQGPRPIEITPGETKVIKLTVSKDTILLAKNSTEAKLLLSLSNEILQSIVAKNPNSLIKEK